MDKRYSLNSDALMPGIVVDVTTGGAVHATNEHPGEGPPTVWQEANSRNPRPEVTGGVQM